MRSFNNRGPRRPFSTRKFNSRPPRRGGNGQIGQYINPARFINKAVSVEESAEFMPQHKFQNFNIDPALKSNILNKGYKLPTPIQDKAIPHLLNGKDIVGIADTGTGKTAAFLIPLINKILVNRSEKVLIVVPTRELAIQIDFELKSLTKALQVYSVYCVGGMSIGRQISELRLRHNFVIGTPGRLKDLIARKNIFLSEFKTIVLDEADRMLDMGFINDIRLIMAGLPKTRHTLFFSATLSREIEGMIYEFLREPVRISLKTRDTSQNVEQDVVKVEKGTNKLEVLRGLLKQKEFSKVLVFGRTKHGVEKLSRTLVQIGFRADSIHGNKNHSGRQRALMAFKNNRVQVLVATDVAARGLDIPNVSHVINFELPNTYEDYIHRIGRTGRGDQRGTALTFID
ncbi:MAG: DEAD/DEAH box helicase [Candidatus Sungbacteria bacterium]|uniref:DEAD/DEAH box helicase n=1 Tax=Candidatus Sungiibacteriota bacterium TaxID=2750080 RepID=A0A9D6HPQ7_9BACT|nr:DEAD/DEAH box helicase [Candidatus Sungbacteria bacterium]